MAKADLQAKAKELGITFTGKETVAELEELIKDATPPGENVPSTPENNPDHFQDASATPEVEDAKTIAPEAKTSFDVYNADGGLIRTYSVVIHGADAEKLANEFAAHSGGTVR